MAMRCSAALSCRFPVRFIRTLPRVFPDQTGNGATPAFIAKQASDRNRDTFAVSPAIFAAVNGPQPGTAVRCG